MRLPFPDRFQWKYVVLYILLLLIAQLVEGTNVQFALLISVYIVLFTAAFNTAGGMEYPSGSFILFTGVLVVLLGVTYKVFTGEAGDKHLTQPVATVEVYCAGMAGLWLAAFFTRKFSPKRGYLASIGANETMMRSAIGCFLIGVALNLAFGSEYSSQGTLGSAVRQFNRFPQLAILLATTYQVKQTNGQKGFNWVSTGAILFTFAGGVIYSSKEGMFAGPVTWLLAAWAAGYNFRSKQLIFGGIFVWFMLYFMVPYSQYVRAFRDENGNRAANQKVAMEYFFRLGEVRRLDVESSDEAVYLENPHFYDHYQGLVDRLSMFPYDDKLVSFTNEGNVFGLYPLYHAYINVVPHILWPDKPFFFTANTYGREVGVLGDDDLTTGISFSPIADTYHEAKWFGVFFVFPVIAFMYFLLMDSVTGSVKKSPWPLLPIALNAHLAPEGMLDGLVLQTTYGVLGILIVAWVVRYIFPMTVLLLTGGDKTVVRKTIEFRLGTQPLARPAAAVATESGGPAS